MATPMTRDKRDRDHAFRPEDEIDEVFGSGNPNPDRTACASEDVLQAAGSRALPIEHPVYEHLAECSACYRKFRRYQRPVGVPSRVPTALAAVAAVLVAIVGLAYFGGNLGIGPWSDSRTDQSTQLLLIDYRGESITRSEAGDPVRQTITLPRASLAATILLPVGSEPGRYEIRLIDGTQRVRLGKHVSAQLRDFAVRIEVNLDLRSLAIGSYLLEIRRQGEDWDSHRVTIR